jgi:exodeoxyribonuclease VII large subunit
VAVPDMQEVLGQLAAIERNLSNQAKAGLQRAQQDLQIILAGALFRNPLTLVQDAEQRLDELATDLTEATRKLLSEAQRKVSARYEQVVRIEPHRLLGRKTVELNDWKNHTDKAMRAILNNCQMQLTARENRLTALNPKSVLHRGYSITTSKETGLLVRTSQDVQTGDDLLTELAGENFIESKVTKK